MWRPAHLSDAPSRWAPTSAYHVPYHGHRRCLPCLLNRKASGSVFTRSHHYFFFPLHSTKLHPDHLCGWMMGGFGDRGISTSKPLTVFPLFKYLNTIFCTPSLWQPLEVSQMSADRVENWIWIKGSAVCTWNLPTERLALKSNTPHRIKSKDREREKEIKKRKEKERKKHWSSVQQPRFKPRALSVQVSRMSMCFGLMRMAGRVVTWCHRPARANWRKCVHVWNFKCFHCA